MKLLKAGLLGWLLFALGCQRATETETFAPPPTALTAEQRPTGKMARAPVRIQMAQIIPIERPQGLQSREVRFAAVSFKLRLKAGAEVTLVPLGVELPAAIVQVIQAVAVENPCSDALPKLYDTELAPLADPVWLSAPTPFNEKRFSENAPFDVCVIYPAVAQARALNRGLLDAATLPKKVPLANIVLALDTTGDDEADVLLVEYCCDQPQAARGACDLTCSAVYVRAPNGAWRIAETQTPC